VWQGRPDMVSKGAQKNFAEFAKITGTEWEKSETGVNEDYYKRLVAKAIVFRETERIVSSQEWYEGGYRANIVAYAIAKLGSDVESLGKHLDWDLIWRRQGMGEALGAAIAVSASAVNDVLLAPPAGMRNISEWAKQQACWNRVQGLEIDWPLGWLQELLSSKEQQARAKAARSDQRQLNGIAAQTAVVEAGADFWRRVNKWGRQKDLLSEKEQSILKTCAAIPKKVPTEKQSVAALEALARLHTEGCQLGPDIIPT
ncbi:MAG: AIPR family protein, partial [Actinomycetota bacterium]|jgi:hypothetical protein|nr:AIPR family protein [Actinomycetota bacterium]